MTAPVTDSDFEPRDVVSSEPSPAASRRIAHRTRGTSHGSITRLLSPSDPIAELTKPFIFLDRVELDTGSPPVFGWHPHSGIATLTLLLEGEISYEDATGAAGTMSAGAVEWLQAGGGTWHKGSGASRGLKGYQLWIALPPELERGAALSQYFPQESFPVVGPARILLGELGAKRSPIAAPAGMNYLEIDLQSGETWHYHPPPTHTVAWVAVHEGTAMTQHSQAIPSGELAVFEKGAAPITFEARGRASFLLGSSQAHPYDLVVGDYSVHTRAHALRRGEASIEFLGRRLRRAGRL